MGDRQTRTLETEALVGRQLRIQLRVLAGAIAGLSEMQAMGALKID
jgi:hypothetical protein